MILDELKVGIQPHKNTLVIYCDKIVRLVDVEFDYICGNDFYYIYDSKDGIENCTACFGYIPLKGFILDDDYNNMVNIWNLNNVNKAI